MRLVSAAAALATLAAAVSAPAFGQTTCKLEHAVYADRELGYELRFRPGKPWEMIGMTESIMDFVTPKGQVLWGNISGNMGVSRDVGRLYFGCPSPSPEGRNLTDEEAEACLQWEGVVYALNDGEPGPMPFGDERAPQRLLLSDLGRKIRYSEVSEGPADEPWDVLDFKRCAK